MKHSEIQRNEREEIRNEIVKLLKINPSYMMKRKQQGLKAILIVFFLNLIHL